MSDENRPVPVPRPRQSKTASDEIDATSKVYENYTIKAAVSNSSVYDALNEQLSELRAEMQKPIPTPRARVANRNYENTQLNNHHHHQPELPPKTGAIRKTANIPKVENNLNDDKVEDEAKIENEERIKKDTEDIMSLSSSTTSGKSYSEKYTTPSPR